MGTSIDLVNLSWCLGEIRQSFSKAEALLEKQLAAEPDDFASLRTARAYIHQAYGALLVINLPGAVAVVREIECVLDASENNVVALSGDLVSRLNAAMHAVFEYLDDLTQGVADQALLLFPYFKALLEARGAERIHPADLLSVDLNRSLAVVKRDETALGDDAIVKIKQDFETGLLRYLREPGSARGVEYMFSAVSTLERSNLAGSNRNFWRVVMAFFDALRTQALPPDFYSRRLLARVNLQLRQTLDRAAPIADRLFKDTLFSLAYAKDGSPIVAHVRQIYELEGVVPQDFETPLYGRHDLRAVRAARDALAKAKVAWDKVMRGSQSEMSQVSHALEAFRDAVEQLPGSGMKSLAASLLETRRVLNASPDALRDPAQAPLTLELATAILFAEQVLEQGGRAGETYDPQASEMSKRLASAASGSGDRLGDVPGWLRAFARAAQERLTMTTFVAETLGNMRSIEKDLDTYFRDTSKTQGLPDATRHLTQVAGAMTLLGHQDAAAASQLALEQVSLFAQAQEPPPRAEFERLAASLAALGFFVEGLLQPERQGTQFEFDRVLGQFRAVKTPLRKSDSLVNPDSLVRSGSLDEPTVLEQSTASTESLLVSLARAPEDEGVRGQLREALENVRDVALLQDDGELRNKANAAITLLADSADSGDNNLDQLSASISNLAPVQLSNEIAAAKLPESEAAVDTELLEIFLEEANEVLAAIQESQKISQNAPADRDSLTTIRRGFHTLKGSSRMVGLNSFGEAGWAMEQVLNVWMAEERPGTPALHALIEWSSTYFSAWTALLAQDSASTIRPAAVVVAADQFRAGLTPLLTAYGSPIAGVFEAKDETNDDTKDRAQDDSMREAHDEAGDAARDEALQAAEVADSFNQQRSMPSAEARQLDEIELHALVADSAQDLSTDVTDFGVDMDLAIASMVAETPHASVIAGSNVAGSDVAGSDVAGFDPAGFDGEDHGHENSSNETPSDVVLIDGREVSRPLYMIFLGEADDLVAMLLTDSVAWRTEKIRHIDEPVIRAAHSLKGSAALVGLEVVHQIARALESIYLRLNAHACQLTDEQTGTMIAAVDQVQLMLHQFAGGREPSHNPETLLALMSLEAGLLPAPELHLADEDLMSLEDPEPMLELRESLPESPYESPYESSLAAQPEAIICLDELDPDLLPIFIEEAADYLPQIGEDLRRWAENPASAEPAQHLMRAMHTVKGSARMAGAMALGQHVHEMETQIESLLLMQTVPLDMIEALTADHDHTVALFESIKDPARMVSGVAALAVESAVSGVSGVVAEAEADAVTGAGVVKDADAVAERSTAGVAGAQAPGVQADSTALAVTGAKAREAAAAPTAQLVRVRADLLDRMVNEAGEVSISRSRLDNELGSLRQSLSDLTENVTRLRTQLREIEIQAESQIQARFAQQREQDRSFDPLEFDRFTRFQELSRMLAEAVNDVATVQQNASRNLDTASQDLLRQGQLLRELQQNLMRVRMVQIGSISDRMYRVVRQAAKDADKRVNLDLRGSGAEIDRGVLEKMAGPIEHLLRNSVAHGIESRQERLALGKPETGEIQVEVRQEGNEIVLSFSDDGKGLDIAKITARAIKQGLIPADTVLSDQDAAELIFAAGFSTAEKVTELAGRGVGMDVVRAETSALGGRIDIESIAGKGTRFIVHLPLTLAIAQVVMVTAGEQRFAIPSSSVEQVMQLKPAALSAAYAEHSIEWQGNKLPMAYLGALIELADPKPMAQHYSPVIVVRSGLQRLALHVDAISRNQEVVVKNVGPQIAKVRGVAGATVMGNGDIVLIINAVVMAQAAGNVFEHGVRMLEPLQAELQALPATIMVVDDSVTVRKVTQRLLSRERYEVLLAKDGVDALRQLQDTIPDVMLVDIEMPRMDGFDLTRHIRADDRFKHIPIIMITSRTADKHRNYAQSLGVNVYLGKPFVEEELLAYVSGFLAVGAEKYVPDFVAATP